MFSNLYAPRFWPIPVLWKIMSMFGVRRINVTCTRTSGYRRQTLGRRRANAVLISARGAAAPSRLRILHLQVSSFFCASSLRALLSRILSLATVGAVLSKTDTGSKESYHSNILRYMNIKSILLCVVHMIRYDRI